MTTNETHRLLLALGLADEVMVAGRDLVVGDWVLLPVSGSRNNHWLHIQTVTVDGPRNVLVTVREPDGSLRRWRLDGAWIYRRSLVPQAPPTPNGQRARKLLSENWAGTKFRVHTIKAGVTVRWADGPSYDSVVGLLRAAGVQRIRAERQLSPRLRAAAVIRATIFPAVVGAGCVELVARAIATQSASVFTENELALADVLAAASGASPSIENLANTLRNLGIDTLEAILAPPSLA